MNHDTILVPIMVIKEDNNTPLSLFHTTKEGIKQSIDTRKCIFYNKSTHSLYKTSLNSNDLIKEVSINCDRTSILFVVAGGDFDSYINILNLFYWNKRLKGGMRDLYKIMSNSVLYGEVRHIRRRSMKIKICFCVRYLKKQMKCGVRLIQVLII